MTEIWLNYGPTDLVVDCAENLGDHIYEAINGSKLAEKLGAIWKINCIWIAFD